MNWLHKKDQQGRLQFVDITALDFSVPEICQTLGVTRTQLNTSLHLFKPDGSYVKDLDAIHLAYVAIGWGWLTWPSRLPLLRGLTDWLFYQWKWRVRGIKTPRAARN